MTTITAKIPDSLKARLRTVTNNLSGFVREAIETKLAESKRDPFKPKTPVTKAMWKLRQEYLAEGGETLSIEEINAEVARRRGVARRG